MEEGKQDPLGSALQSVADLPADHPNKNFAMQLSYITYEQSRFNDDIVTALLKHMIQEITTEDVQNLVEQAEKVKKANINLLLSVVKASTDGE